MYITEYIKKRKKNVHIWRLLSEIIKLSQHNIYADLTLHYDVSGFLSIHIHFILIFFILQRRVLQRNTALHWF